MLIPCVRGLNVMSCSPGFGRSKVLIIYPDKLIYLIIYTVNTLLFIYIYTSIIVIFLYKLGISGYTVSNWV